MAGQPGPVVLALALLVGSEVGWGASACRPVPGSARIDDQARRQAANLAGSDREHPDDLLFGYDPVYLRPWERSAFGPTTVIPRADPKLAVRPLRHAEKPLGRGVWVLEQAVSYGIATNG